MGSLNLCLDLEHSKASRQASNVHHAVMISWRLPPDKERKEISRRKETSETEALKQVIGSG